MEAGLPNITGRVGNATHPDDHTSGAFYVESGSSLGWYQFQPYNQYFDASRCSSVYRDDIVTVQPESLTTRYYIKF